MQFIGVGGGVGEVFRKHLTPFKCPVHRRFRAVGLGG